MFLCCGFLKNQQQEGEKPVDDLKWITLTQYTDLPANAVQAGTDSDGTTIYVGRAHHEEDVMAAKILPEKEAAYISYDGEEILKKEIEILVGSGFEWVNSSIGRIELNAVSTGSTKTNETLYIGRAYHETSLTVGKVHPLHQCLFIGYAGKEHRYTDYEMLIKKPI